jgi:hypothetical protein
MTEAGYLAYRKEGELTGIFRINYNCLANPKDKKTQFIQ